MTASQLVVSNPSVSGSHFLFGTGSVDPATGYSGYFQDNPDIPGALDPDWALIQWQMTGPQNQPEYLTPATANVSPVNDYDPYYGSALYSVTNSDGTGSFSVFQSQDGEYVYDIEDSISPATAPVGAAAPLQDLFLSTTPFASNQSPITLNHPLTVSFADRIREAVVSGTDTTGDASNNAVATGLLGIVLTYNSATFHATLFLQTVLTDSRYGSAAISYQNSSFDGYTTTVIYNDQTDNNIALPYVSSNNVQCVDLSVNTMLDDALANVPSLTATDTGTENLANWTFNSLYMGIEISGDDYAPGVGLTGSTTLDLQLSNIEIAEDPSAPCSYNPAPADGSAVISDTLLASPNAIPAPSGAGSPTVVAVMSAPSVGEVTTGELALLTLTMSKAVTVAGGASSLTLNDGGTAAYDAARSTPTSLVFDYTVLAGQSTPALAVTGLNEDGATIQDAAGDNANFTGALTTLDGLAVNGVSADAISAAYTAILCTPPPTTVLDQVVAAIDAGETTLGQFESGLIASNQATGTTLAALVTIDACYNATPGSASLSTAATALSGTVYSTAAELQNMGYSDANAWTIMASGWGADPTSNFYSLYDADATGTTAGYTAFINTVYTREFGYAPTATNLQNLLTDVAGIQTLLAGVQAAPTIQVMAGLYGYLLEVGQTYGIGQYASAATAFLQAAANGTAAYGPELTQEFPSGIAADSGVMTITGSDQLIDPGAGSDTMQFLSGTSGDTLMLHTGGVDQLSGFDPGTDVLDFSAVLNEAGVDLTGGVAALGNYVTIADQGANAVVDFDPTGHGGGSAVAVLQGLGSTVTNLGGLIAQGAVRIV